jgi:hypothetical protein
MKLILESPEITSGIVETQLNEATQKPEKQYYIQGVFSTIGEKNRNGRIYPRHLWEREVSRYQGELRGNSINSLMEYEHPAREYVDPICAVAKIVSLTVEGNKVIGKAKLLNNEKANILKNLIDEGINIGVSSRGVGNVGKDGVVEDFKLITYDVVPNPSDYNAYTRGINENVENGIVLDKNYYIDSNTGKIVLCTEQKCSTYDKKLVESAIKTKFTEMLNEFSKKVYI